MKITYELELSRFEAWGGGEYTLDRVINEGKVEELEKALEELYPDGLDETTLNDILWFEDEWIFEMCGIRTESEIREELTEAQGELEELMENFLGDSEDLTEEEKEELWTSDYESDVKELEEKITELEEELENI